MKNIYKYSELEGVLKVGDEVRAVPGKGNPCSQLNNDGSNTQKITEIEDYYFYINGCSHGFSCDDHYLEIVNRTPTWETLRVGDLIERKGYRVKVLGVLGELVFISCSDNFESTGSYYTKKELIYLGYTIVTPEEPKEETHELSMQEIADKFGISVKELRIKDAK